MPTDPHRSTWDTCTNAWSPTDPPSRADLPGACLVHGNKVDDNDHSRVLTPGISHGGHGPDGKLLRLTGVFGPITAASL